jgi:hypothetical protein
MRAIKIPANILEPMEEIDIPNAYPSINRLLAHANDAIRGAWIERVSSEYLVHLSKTSTSNVVMYVDEEGRLKGLERNQRACCFYDDVIVGDAYLTGESFVGERDMIDLPAEVTLARVSERTWT